MTWLSADDDWPIHPRHEAQKALKRAKDAGWFLKELSGHGFAWLQCPVDEHDDRCRLQIYSTAGDKSGTATAQAIENTLQRCERQLPAVDQTAVRETLRKLAKVGELLDYAESLRGSQEAAHRADDIYEGALEMDEAGDREAADVEIGHELDRSERLEVEAWTGAAAFGLGHPWPPTEGAQKLIDAAKERFDEIMQGLPTGDMTDDIRDQIDFLTARFGAFNSDA
jgi:hypothetical protein